MKTYNVEEAAEYCKCHAETIREYIRAGKLVASKPGRGYCIRQSALDAFLIQLENGQVQASLENWSEKLCLETTDCTNATVGTILTSGRQAESALDALLAPKTSRKRSSSATS